MPKTYSEKLSHFHSEPNFSEWSTLLGERLNEPDYKAQGFWNNESLAAARLELLNKAYEYTDALGDIVSDPVTLRAKIENSPVVVATGHQPEIYHMGIASKSYALNELATSMNAVGVDVVVDTDVEPEFGFLLPWMSLAAARPSIPLVENNTAWFAAMPVPSVDDISTWSQNVIEAAQAYGIPEVRTSVEEYLRALLRDSSRCSSMGDASVSARRHFEREAGFSHLELPVSHIIGTDAWFMYVSEIIADSERFSASYNEALDEFRVVHKTRSKAQPFPDLKTVKVAYENQPDKAIPEFELPFWCLVDGSREPLHIQKMDSSYVAMAGQSDGLSVGGEDDARTLCELGTTPKEIADSLRNLPFLIAPKAITLTLFTRTFLCDLFIHGTGGYRYDEVCDGVAQRFFSTQLAPKVSCTADVVLPLVEEPISEESLQESLEKINRITAHPEDFLEEAALSEEALERCNNLLLEKNECILAMRTPDVDKKIVGLRIKEINSLVANELAGFKEALSEELELRRNHMKNEQMLLDRGYSFPLFDVKEMSQFFEKNLRG